MLDEIEEGNYELIALPLPIKDGDGSPVRAVIRPI
jgi:arylformamidase